MLMSPHSFFLLTFLLRLLVFRCKEGISFKGDFGKKRLTNLFGQNVFLEMTQIVNFAGSDLLFTNFL